MWRTNIYSPHTDSDLWYFHERIHIIVPYISCAYKMVTLTTYVMRVYKRNFDWQCNDYPNYRDVKKRVNGIKNNIPILLSDFFPSKDSCEKFTQYPCCDTCLKSVAKNRFFDIIKFTFKLFCNKIACTCTLHSRIYDERIFSTYMC